MTRTERLILSLLYTVLAKIDSEQADSYSTCRTIVEEGYTTRYGDLNAGIGPEELSTRVQEEVYDILNMHRSLKNALQSLGKDSGIEAKDVQFRGFDGNNETEHLGFGRFLTERGLFVESPVENSHMPVLATYRRQLEAWRSCGDPFHLTKEEVVRILKERVHPEHR